MPKASKGFTLIEMLISLTLAAVFLTVILELSVMLTRSDIQTARSLQDLIRFHNFYTAHDRNQQEDNTSFSATISTTHPYGVFWQYRSTLSSVKNFSVYRFVPSKVSSHS